MKLVVDTNIVFSALLNPQSAIEILTTIQDDLIFFAPDLFKEELKRYSSRIAAYSKLGQNNLFIIEALVLSTINFISEELISDQSWRQAISLTQGIDEDDTPFVALGIELNAKLWTGDKILSKGLAKKGLDLTITTADLKKLIT